MRFLLSYAYIRKDKKLFDFATNCPDGCEVLIDSGAFTAHTTGKKIELEEYIDFCKALPENVERYIQLDVLENKEATLQNLDIMYREGLKPIPVLTIDMDVEEHLPRLLEYSDDICLAGGALMSTNAFLHRVRRCQAIAPDAKFHGLAFTKQAYLKRAGLYSVDSSTWANGLRFVSVFNYVPGRSRMAHIQITNLRKKPYAQWPVDAKEFFMRKGLPASSIHDKTLTDRIKNRVPYFALLGMGGFHKLYDRVADHTKFYFAVSTALNLHDWAVYLMLSDGNYHVPVEEYREWSEPLTWEETRAVLGSVP